MQLFEATSFYLFLQCAVFFVNVYGRCPSEGDVLPMIPNGHTSNTDNVILYSDGTAEGYYEVECDAGYALDTDIGGRVTCLPAGSWSQPLPQCKSMGRCPIPILFTFLETTRGIYADQSHSFIYTDGVDEDQALGGSNIMVQCANGYKNVGGSLTIICTEANTWTTFPNCVSTSSSTTTAVPAARCPFTDDMRTFPNGYMSDTKALTVYNDDTAVGTAVISCSSGYVLDSVSGGMYECNSGTWSPRPYCIKTARCSLPTLRMFLNDLSATGGLEIVSQRLLSNSDENDEILVGSYILFMCKEGYNTNDNNQKVTCNVDGQWSAYPHCLSTSTGESSGRCPSKDDALPKVMNGYMANVDHLKQYSDGTAEGYYDIDCKAGYALDTDIGGRITCLPSGSWSQPLPQCKTTGRCPVPILFTFLETTRGIYADQSHSFIYTDGVDEDQALGGSNIMVQCANGYRNVGGSLTIICTEANTWTTFPNCVSTSSSTTTAVPAARCPFTDDMRTFSNGYMSNTKALTVYNDNTAKGTAIISCSPGYVLDSVSGGRYKCNSGTWSPRPYCIKTARCSLPTLKNFVDDYTATKGSLEVSSQSLSTNEEETDEVLVGSYMQFKCKTGYRNTDKNLKVVCNTNGQWSPFPSCIPLSTTGRPRTSTSTGSPRKKY